MATLVIKNMQADDKHAADEAERETDSKLKMVIAERCTEDKWSADAVTCFGTASNVVQLQQCQDNQLSKEQAEKLERAALAVIQSSGGRRQSKADIAIMTAKQYAYEAYPSWAAAHPDKVCPDRFEELNEYMNKTDMNDPWGRPYKMICGPNLPAGAKGLAVISQGEDGKEGTADDIKSWEGDEEKPSSTSADTKLQITGIEPQKGDADGGTYVRITGNRFIADGPRNAKVYFGTRQGTIVRFASDSELIVEAPGGKPNETVDVLLIFDPGGQLKIPNGFTFVKKP